MNQKPTKNRLIHKINKGNILHQLINIAKNWLPPVLVRQTRRLFRRDNTITFEGPFSSWNEAKKQSEGYDSNQILEKVLSAILKVKNGEAVFERDSVLFDKIQYSWPVTSGLMWAAARNGGRLSVLDFGGSLGSSYYQNRKFLEGLQNVRWAVVEQVHFVQAGRQYMQDERLVFYPTIAECVSLEKPNIVLLSSVLQYLPDPYAVLDELLRNAPDLIVVDLTIVNNQSEDRIFLQHVPKSIYKASYPVYTLSEDRLIRMMDIASYKLIDSFPSISFPVLDYIRSFFKGYIFIKS